MAHSIQTFGDKSEIFNDFDLIALICLMADEVHRSPDKFHTIGQAVGSWRASLAGYGPGVIDLNLDAVVSSKHLARDFETLLSVVAARIKSFGQTIPSSFLNSQCRAPGVIFSDYSATLLLQALEKLRRLISPP